VLTIIRKASLSQKQWAAVALAAVGALLILGLCLPGKASAEATAVEDVPDAAAMAGDAVEAVAATATSAPPVAIPSEPPATETASPSVPSADTTAPPPPPPSPSPQPREALEHTAAAVTAVVDTATSSRPVQAVARDAQEGLADVGDQATETGRAVLDGTTRTVRRTASRTEDLIGSGRGVVPSTLDSTKTAHSLSGPIEPPSPKPPAGGLPSAADESPLSPLGSEAAMPPDRPLAPGVGLFFSPPPAPVIPTSVPATSHSDNGGPHIAAVIGPHELGNSIDEGSSGTPLPTAPSPPVPSLPVAFDALITTAPGGAGSVLLLAILALSCLLAPTFASKLRMHAGNCRPAPFVSLLERPG
jgi:hypothetical protein